MMNNNLVRSLMAVILAAILCSCLPAPPPAPQNGGTCPGRYINCRPYDVYPRFYRIEEKGERLQVGVEIPAKTSLRFSLPAGHYRVVSLNESGLMLGEGEISVAISGSGLFELKPPEIGVQKNETLYWWVKLEPEKK